MALAHPNIVLIMTDQQRFDTIRAFGNSHMRTPHLDRLAAEGVYFENCFVTAPSCAPSRASFFSGLYPHNSGVFKNADAWIHSWVQHVNDGGYHCVNIGKMHTFPYEEPMGFHERFVVENKDRYLEGRYFFDRWDLFLQAQGIVKPQRELYRKQVDYRERLGAFEWELPKATHPDVFVGELAQWWIRQKPIDQPLFLQIGFPGPHPPYDPLMEYVEQYLNLDLPLPTLTEEELNSQPSALKELREHNCRVDHDSIAWSKTPTPAQLHRLRAHYYANITMIDEQVGEILNALDEKGILEDSIVVFTSDHGDCMGDHGHIQKWTMFDEAVKVPMIVWSPKYVAGGRILTELYQQFDIAATILGMCNIEGHGSQWRAITALPSDVAESGREYVFAEHARDPILEGTEFMTMIRSKKWKLVHFVDDSNGQLFDLKNDPGESRNLWNDPVFEHKRQELLCEILNWRIRSSLKNTMGG